MREQDSIQIRNLQWEIAREREHAQRVRHGWAESDADDGPGWGLWLWLLAPNHPPRGKHPRHIGAVR